MVTEMHLTAAERKMFDALSSDIKEGWTVHDETLQFQDSKDRRRVRMELLDVANPDLLQIRDNASQYQDTAAVAAAVGELDLSDLNESDFYELCFAVGPDVLTVLIAQLFSEVKTEDDFTAVVGLLHIRHELLITMQ